MTVFLRIRGMETRGERPCLLACGDVFLNYVDVGELYTGELTNGEANVNSAKLRRVRESASERLRHRCKMAATKALAVRFRDFEGRAEL